MFRVVAPLVYLRVPDVSGALVSCTFYKDAIVPEGADQESLQRHVREGMVEELVIPEPDEAPKPRSRTTK